MSSAITVVDTLCQEVEGVIASNSISRFTSFEDLPGTERPSTLNQIELICASDHRLVMERASGGSLAFSEGWSSP
jgi:hypothetical protein